MDTPTPDSAPAALADLVAAGLVSHEMIGDPDRLGGGEAAALRALCGLVAGAVWRIEPFHYAFRAAPSDLGGALGRTAPGEWAAALETALQVELGTGAAWVSAADLLPAEDAALEAPLVLLRAHGRAVEGALEAAPPEVQAVVNARFAVLTARLAAGAEAGSALDDRLLALEANQRAILAALQVVTDRLEAQAEGAAEIAGRLEALAGPAAFQETLGVTVAELLARLERRAEEAAPLRVPQFS